MMNKTDNIFESYLTESGLNSSFLDQSSLDVRLYHDLGFYGDVAEGYIDLLNEKYCVDISDFKFDEYFPSEFEGNSNTQRVIFWIFPFLKGIGKNKQAYKPFTFRMIKHAIDTKRLR